MHPAMCPGYEHTDKTFAAHAYVQVLMCALACEDCKFLWQQASAL